MTPSMWLLLVIAAAAILAYAWRLRQLWRRNALHGAAKDRALRRISQMGTMGDTYRRLLEADSILDAALTDLGYTGTMGEKLKKAAKVIPGLNDVWKAHKLRNRIAHEPRVSLSNQEANEAINALKRAIEKFCR